MVFGARRAYTARRAERVYVHNGPSRRRSFAHSVGAHRAASGTRQSGVARGVGEAPTPLRTLHA